MWAQVPLRPATVRPMMNRFRRRAFAAISATIALLSMLVVATAAMASGPLTSQPIVMDMSADMPCEPEGAVCSVDCAIFCQVLVVQAPVVDQPPRHLGTAYRVGETVLGSLSVEADDPPPRQVAERSYDSTSQSNGYEHEKDIRHRRSTAAGFRHRRLRGFA